MKYKKLFILLLFLFNLSQSGWSTNFVQEFIVSEKDRELAKKYSFISGIEFDETSQFKQKIMAPVLAAVTIGFSKIDNTHAYLVFERPQKRQDEKTEILTTGVHLRPNQSYIDQGDYLGPIYGNGKSTIIKESGDTVVHKFVRRYIQKDETDNDGYIVTKLESVEPVYSKFKTFIITNDEATKVLKFLESYQEQIEFSLAGYSINPFKSKISHNCCTFVASILQHAGIALNFFDNNSWRRDHVWLKDIINQYEQSMLKTNAWKINDPSLKNFIYYKKIFVPLTSEELLEKYL